ncbi:hypothetical protein [Robertmurraya mangrovi]|nr:hypothetical protein [Bacillus sp. 31A1R]
MISKADVIERLGSMIGKELTSQNLHEALFCEAKHKKILRRFSFGTHTYVQYKVQIDKDTQKPAAVDITIPGNPNTFRVGLVEENGQLIINSEPRINFSYLS